MKVLVVAALAALVVAISAPVAWAQSRQGSWVLSEEQGHVQLQLQWGAPGEGKNSSHSHDIDAQALGIAAALASAGQHETFTLHREAGDFALDGWIGKHQGAGHFTFAPNEQFFANLRARGYDVRDADQQMAFATLDITSEYIAQIESLHFKPSVTNLIAMKALNVTPQFVADLQRAGVSDLSEQQVISLRAVHVTPNYIAEIAAAGFPRLEANQYVTLRAMHVDGAYISYLRAHGFKNLTVNQVVTMKAERI